MRGPEIFFIREVIVGTTHKLYKSLRFADPQQAKFAWDNNYVSWQPPIEFSE